MRERASIKHAQRGAATLIMTVLLMLLIGCSLFSKTEKYCEPRDIKRLFAGRGAFS